MSSIAVCLPASDADGNPGKPLERTPTENASSDHVGISDPTNNRTRLVATPRTLAPWLNRRSDEHQSNNLIHKRKRFSSESLAESDSDNTLSAGTPATTPSSHGSALKKRGTKTPPLTTKGETSPIGNIRGRKKQGPNNAKCGEPALQKKLKRDEDEKLWEMERIVGARIEDKTYVHWYQVKWKGWSAKHNTWEPKKNLASCQDLINDFMRKEDKLGKQQTKSKKNKIRASI